ncbi:MAG: triose-phosphate isomerase [Bacteroidales bacterium]
MRKNIVAGNWKMNTTIKEGKELASSICDMITSKPLHTMNASPEVLLFPPFVHISEIVKIAKKTKGVFVGAQNCYSAESGAYTGEVSAAMIKSVGATHVLVGHSERRQYFNEDHQMLAAKVSQALDNDLIPVYCCGELLPERQANKQFEIVKEQIVKSLFWMDESDFKKIIIAYEPVWAIGTGETATPQQAQEMHDYIRGIVSEKYGTEVADNMTILYGGSCNAKNANDLFKQEDVDGGLVGGASLKSADFFKIINSF